MHNRRRTFAIIIVLVLVVPFAFFRLSGQLGHLGRHIGPVPHYLAAQAKEHSGAYATVSGRIADVHVSSGGTLFLDFGSDFPSQSFTAVVFAHNRSRFSDFERLSGHTVEVTGRIDIYKGQPEMILRSPTQLRIVE